MGTGRNRAPVASSASTATSSSRDAVISRRDRHQSSDDALDAFLRFAARAKTTLLKAHGVDLNNNRFLILQGEVEQCDLFVFAGASGRRRNPVPPSVGSP